MKREQRIGRRQDKPPREPKGAVLGSTWHGSGMRRLLPRWLQRRRRRIGQQLGPEPHGGMALLARLWEPGSYPPAAARPATAAGGPTLTKTAGEPLRDSKNYLVHRDSLIIPLIGLLYGALGSVLTGSLMTPLIGVLFRPLIGPFTGSVIGPLIGPISRFGSFISRESSVIGCMV